MKPTFIGC